jgi:RNA polymerase-binding transcription factor DksA
MAERNANEPGFTSEELLEIRQRLLSRIDALREDIQRELAKCDGEHYQALADRVADPAEHAVADLLVDLDLAEIDRDVEELRGLEGGLLRLALGRYGVCTDCEAPIDAARLHYEPGAMRCLACQQRYERRAGERGRPTL